MSTNPEPMTDHEHRAVEMAGELYRHIAEHVIGPGPARSMYEREIVTHIHAIQSAVMAQAAARCYPDRYKTMGQVPPFGGG